MPLSLQSSPAENLPGYKMAFSWLFMIMMPAAVLAWSSTKKVTVALGATLATPTLAILQGAVGILTYRIHFGDAPIPLVPSHGVVVVRPRKPLSDDNQAQLQADEKTALLSATGGHLSASSDADRNEILQAALNSAPLRILVIGDSLAIGVGQSKCCTPVLPEVIAKTLSKELGGKAVFWTCHGAPGASTGWIVRELERGVDYLNELTEDKSYDQQVDEEISPNRTEVQSSSSETSEELSDDSSTEGDANKSSNRFNYSTAGSKLDPNTLGLWKQRLSQHRKIFDPEFLGPYDVVVVLTGSNDLKSAFFPFLLTGEDAEFRRQAQIRGGSFTEELRRLLDTLNKKMKKRLESIRLSVEAAKVSVRERVDETLDLFAPGRVHRLSSRRLDKAAEATTSGHSIDTEGAVDVHPQDRHFPLVVLPGLPARVIPIFRTIPLRWLAVPIVDIMDSHKIKLSKSHPGEVLFVRAPLLEELGDYEAKSGELWEQKCLEEEILSMRDIRLKDQQRVELSMRAYYSGKGQSDFVSVENGARRRTPFLSRLRNTKGLELFSVDNIHPRDSGYDFWGRHIATGIIEELKRRKRLSF